MENLSRRFRFMNLIRAQEATAENAMTRVGAMVGAGAGAVVGAGAGVVVGAGAFVIGEGWALAKARVRSTERSWFTERSGFTSGSGVEIWTSSDTTTQDSRGVPETPAPPPDAGKPKDEVEQQPTKRKVKPDKETPTPATLGFTRLQLMWILVISLVILVVFCSQSKHNPVQCSQGAQKTNQQSRKGPSNEDFKNRHLVTANVQVDEGFYDRKMKNINRNRNGKCKRRNTFILSSETSVEDVCKDGGEDWVKPGKRDNLKISKDRFKLIDCVVVDENQAPPNCLYTIHNINNPKYIIVACINGKPVHLEGWE